LWRSAEEQGSRGAEERFIQVLSPLPLRTSAPLLATTQNSLGKLLVARLKTLLPGYFFLLLRVPSCLFLPRRGFMKPWVLPMTVSKSTVKSATEHLTIPELLGGVKSYDYLPPGWKNVEAISLTAWLRLPQM
jgi:hypothetical protein